MKQTRRSPRLVLNESGKIQLIVMGLNLLAALAAVGVFAYTKLIFKRPPITEAGERARLEAGAGQSHSARKVHESQPGLMPIESMTVNISSAPEEARTDLVKTHLIKMSFSLQLGDIDRKSEMEAVKSVLVDQVMDKVAKKRFEELNTVQGRYLLRNEIVDLANELLDEPLVSNVFFDEFLVQ